MIKLSSSFELTLAAEKSLEQIVPNMEEYISHKLFDNIIFQGELNSNIESKSYSNENKKVISLEMYMLGKEEYALFDLKIKNLENLIKDNRYLSGAEKQKIVDDIKELKQYLIIKNPEENAKIKLFPTK